MKRISALYPWIALVSLTLVAVGCSNSTTDSQPDQVCADVLATWPKLGSMPDTSDFWHIFRNKERLSDTGAVFTGADIGACLILRYFTDTGPARASDSMFVIQDGRVLAAMVRAAEPALFAISIRRLFEIATFDIANEAVVILAFTREVSPGTPRITLRR